MQLVDKILALELEMEKLKEESTKVKEENTKLRELLKRNSKNSSTPPSKDKKKESKATGKPLGSPKGHKDTIDLSLISLYKYSIKDNMCRNLFKGI